MRGGGVKSGRTLDDGRLNDRGGVWDGHFGLLVSELGYAVVVIVQVRVVGRDKWVGVLLNFVKSQTTSFVCFSLRNTDRPSELLSR